MITKKILELLKKLDKIDTSSLFTRYSSRYVWGRYFEMGNPEGAKQRVEEEQRRRELEKFYKMLYHLKKQGFVQKIKNNKKNTFWRATRKGLGWLGILSRKKSKEREHLPLFKRHMVEKDHLKIIIFDIPEILKHYRVWLRQVLLNFGYRKLQKSVWIGDAVLPDEFIKTLKQKKLLDYIHIFAIQRKGSLTDIDF